MLTYLFDPAEVLPANMLTYLFDPAEVLPAIGRMDQKQVLGHVKEAREYGRSCGPPPVTAG
jgi:hypothetical protein